MLKIQQKEGSGWDLPFVMCISCTGTSYTFVLGLYEKGVLVEK